MAEIKDANVIIKPKDINAAKAAYLPQQCKAAVINDPVCDNGKGIKIDITGIDNAVVKQVISKFPKSWVITQNSKTLVIKPTHQFLVATLLKEVRDGLEKEPTCYQGSGLHYDQEFHPEYTDAVLEDVGR